MSFLKIFIIFLPLSNWSLNSRLSLNNWGLNFRLSPVINSIRVEGLVVSGVGNWAFQRLQSLSEGHGIFHVHIDIIVVGVGVSRISRRIFRREISLVEMTSLSVETSLG